MIRWVRTAQIAPGKQADAMTFAKDICEHASDGNESEFLRATWWALGKGLLAVRP